MKHVNIERGIPSSELKPGDVYRVVLSHRILSVVNVMKIISLTQDTVTMMEMPFSNIHLTSLIKNLVFLERIDDGSQSKVEVTDRPNDKPATKVPGRKSGRPRKT